MAASMRNFVSKTLCSKFLFKCRIQGYAIARCKSSVSGTAAPASGPGQWHLYASVSLERKPVISPPMKAIERDYARQLTEMEVELSMLNDHELLHKEDLRRKVRLTSGEATDADLEASAKQTAQDFEDLSNDEFSKFVAASRITAADRANDWHTTRRKLDRHLLLAVQSERTSGWSLPMVRHESGETLRQTVERALSTYCGSKLVVRTIGNAPIGFYKFKYNPKNSKHASEDGAIGGKIFFFRSYYESGEVDPSGVSDVSDYGWLTRGELATLMTNKESYLNCLRKFLVDEDFIYTPGLAFQDKYGDMSLS